MQLIKNPIMPGFFPDPSICRVGEIYYMVHSTFTYFPGIPIFESRDLVNWKQIGNVLDRDSQIPLTGKEFSEGIFAPTIRYYNNKFYVITTNTHDKGTFIVTASDPAGPWSEPYYLGEDVLGIDPSLFFDENGTCWYIGQRNKAESKYYGDCEIWIQRLNLQKMKLEGDSIAVLDGFQKNAVWPEGPHLYHKGDYYYILHAESGTAFHHSVMIARSRKIEGPYEYCKSNPILTHRHLGMHYPITSVGHGDLVEDGHGNWYMTVLACRPQKGYTLLGRETFLAKIAWEHDWPVVNPGIGRLEEFIELSGSGTLVSSKSHRTYTFDTNTLPPEFLTLQNHRESMLSLTARPGYVRLFMKADTLKDRAEPAYLCIRQQHKNFELEATFQPYFGTEGGCAGIAMIQSNENHIRIECFQNGKEDTKFRVIKAVNGIDKELGQLDNNGLDEITFKLSVKGLLADAWLKNKEQWVLLVHDIGLEELSAEIAGGFVGCTIGMYASGNGKENGGYADFKYFTYQGSE